MLTGLSLGFALSGSRFALPRGEGSSIHKDGFTPLASEVEAHFEFKLPRVLEIRRIRNRSAFRRYKAERIGAIDVEIAATYKWRRAESDAIHTRLRMVKHVFRIHTDCSSQVLANSEPLGESHIGAPRSCVLQSIEAEISSRSWHRILQDYLSAPGIGHRLQRAQVLEV